MTNAGARTRSASPGELHPSRGSTVSGPAAAYLVRGDDASLVAQSVRDISRQLVDDRDPSLMVEEHGGASAVDLDVGAVIDACMTPPFLVDRRVVVVRDVGRLSSSDAARLAGYLEHPLPSTVLVLAAGGGAIPQVLQKAVTASGAVIETAVGTGRERTGWLVRRLRDAPVRLDAPAATRLGEHLGDDVARLDGIVATLAAAYGDGSTVGVDQLEPFLGESGGVPPWDLTDAVDAGSAVGALTALRRMLGPGERSAPEVVALLHRHYSGMLRLDGADVRSEQEAAQLLGIRSPYVAGKALTQGRLLGSERIGRAVTLIADADVDVKGRTGLRPEVVLEVLVARLSKLSPTRQGRRRRPTGPQTGRRPSA